MMSLFALALTIAPPAEPQATPAAASNPINPRALEPFERDWVLMDWALRLHDRDRDVRLSIAEATAAADAFKALADGNGDGRVSTYEYDRAREFLLARY